MLIPIPIKPHYLSYLIFAIRNYQQYFLFRDHLKAYRCQLQKRELTLPFLTIPSNKIDKNSYCNDIDHNK
jgi:hypothetical protein